MVKKISNITLYKTCFSIENPLSTITVKELLYPKKAEIIVIISIKNQVYKS